MDVADHGDVRSHARRGFIDGSQVVEMKHVGVRGSGAGELVAPRPDLALVLQVVERCEHAVGRARPVLVRGVKRRTVVAHRLAAGGGGAEIDWMHLWAVKAGGVGVRAGAGQRA